MNTRNVAILSVSHDMMLSLLQGKVKMKLPQHLKVIDGSYDWESSFFKLKLESPSFGPVRRGDPLPYVDFECQERIV